MGMAFIPHLNVLANMAKIWPIIKENLFSCFIAGTTRKLDFGFSFSPLSNTAQAALTILSSSLTSH